MLWQVNGGRSHHRSLATATFCFEEVVKPMVLATFWCSKSRIPYKINEKSMFSAPEMLPKVSGCFWLLLPRGLPSKFKIQNLGARGTGRPGPDNIFAPRPQNFRARGANILWPGCENVAVQAAMALKVARFCFWLTNLIFLIISSQKLCQPA